MIPNALEIRLEVLIDDLIEEGSVATAALASILVAAKEAVRSGNDVALCRRVWSASNDLEEVAEERSPALALPKRTVRTTCSPWGLVGRPVNRGELGKE